jgi:hypothetical protein
MTSVALAPVRLWTRDLGSCLQAVFATLLLRERQDPVTVLGAAWDFRYEPGDWRSEEFYYPCAGRTLAEALAPLHPLTSVWRRAPADGADPLGPLRAQLLAGRLPIAAVDNFYLPFRPAFGDVHAAHLLVVAGIDDERGAVLVSDAQPPEFQGPIPVADFLRAWGSANPEDVQDAFFSNSPLDRRWLEVRVTGEFPAPTRAWLAEVLARNVACLRWPDTGRLWSGLPGVERYVDRVLAQACGPGGSTVLEELYVLSWGLQAQADLHAEFLRTHGVAQDLPALREAAEVVDRVAHAWTGFRMTGAHGRLDRPDFGGDLARHGGTLVRAHHEAADALELALEELRAAAAS